MPRRPSSPNMVFPNGIAPRIGGSGSTRKGEPPLETFILLLGLLLLGSISGNDLTAVAAGILLLLRLSGFQDVLAFLDDHAVDLGVIFLVIGLLLPFATGKITLTATLGGLFRPAGLISIFIGAVSAYLAAEGLRFLRFQPEALVGLIIGSVLGVSFFGGIPTGPLVAAGLAAALYYLVR